MLGANQLRGKGDIEVHPLCLQPFAGRARFLDAVLGQADVTPAGEQIFQIPLALAVTHQHEKPFAHLILPYLFRRHPEVRAERASKGDSTSVILRGPPSSGRLVRAGPAGGHLRMTG